MKARILLFALVCALTGQAQAQSTYPSRPVRIVVPSPPGGGTDIVARVLAAELIDVQSVVRIDRAV